MCSSDLDLVPVHALDEVGEAQELGPELLRGDVVVSSHPDVPPSAIPLSGAPGRPHLSTTLTRSDEGRSVGESTLQRTLRIRATHHYRRADWDEERNRRAFGPVRDPHPHDWVITVTLSGPLDAHGFLVDLPALDLVLAAEVGRLDGTDLNRSVPEMEIGRAHV